MNIHEEILEEHSKRTEIIAKARVEALKLKEQETELKLDKAKLLKEKADAEFEADRAFRTNDRFTRLSKKDQKIAIRVRNLDNKIGKGYMGGESNKPSDAFLKGASYAR